MKKLFEILLSEGGKILIEVNETNSSELLSLDNKSKDKNKKELNKIIKTYIKNYLARDEDGMSNTKIESTLNLILNKLNAIENELKEVNIRLDSLEQRMDNIEQRVTYIEENAVFKTK